MAGPAEEPLALEPALSPRLRMQKEAASVIYSPVYEWQTRILLLQPGHFGEPLVAEMHVVDLLHGPGIVLNTGQHRKRIEYNALSYCWGAPDFPKDILCNDMLYPITENLFNGLQHIRLQGDSLAIWVDALCINQHDTADKSMQIANMLTIFLKAREVIAWLGIGNAHTAHALKMLREDKSIEDEYTQSCVQEILRNPWFRRVWVKQEVFAAQRLYLRYGKDILPWEKLEQNELVLFPRRTSDVRAQIEKGEQRNEYLSRSAHTYSKPSLEDPMDYREDDTDIINVLRQTSGSEATDPKDFVYAVLGMSRATLTLTETCRDEAMLPVDYAKSVSEVFQDVARYIMKRDGCLNVLLLETKFGDTIYGDRLPSWTPDFRNLSWHPKWLQYVSKFLVYVWRNMDNMRFKNRFENYNRSFYFEADILTVQGFVLAHIDGAKIASPHCTCYELASNEKVDSVLNELASGIKVYNNQVRESIGSISQKIRKDVDERLFLHDDYRPEHSHDNGTTYVKLQGISAPTSSHFEKFEYSLALSTDMLVRKSIELNQALYDIVRYDIRTEEKNPNKIPHTIYVNTYPETDILRGLPLTPELRTRICHRCALGKEPDTHNAMKSHEQLHWLLNQPVEQWKPKTWVVPDTVQAGDAILFVSGGLLPLAVRPIQGASTYQFLGPAALTEKTMQYTGDGLLFLDYLKWYTCAQYSILEGLLRVHGEDNRLETFRLV